MIDTSSLTSVGSIQGFNQNLLESIKPKTNSETAGAGAVQKGFGNIGGGKDIFGDMIGSLVRDVDAKGKTSAAEANKVLLGESDNIHQSMIAAQEASLSFSLLVEVRNKLVMSYQELMKMPV